jgi:hypothetical protein
MAELEALLDDVAARVQGVARPESLEDLSQDHQLVLALFVSVFQVFLGIRALLKERLSEEARMLSRPLLDDTARLAYFARSHERLAEFALRFRQDSLAHEEWLLKAAQQNGWQWAEEGLERIAEDRTGIQEAAEDAGIELEALPKPRKMLEEVGQPQLYYWHARASNSLHSSLIGLSSRFYPSEDGSVIRIPLEGTDKEIAQVGVMAMQATSLSAVAFVEMMAPDRRQEFVDYRERVLRITGDLYERIGLGILSRDQPTG